MSRAHRWCLSGVVGYLAYLRESCGMAQSPQDQSDADRRFRLMFGRDRSDVLNHEVNPEVWVREHAAIGARNVYRQTEQSLKDGTSLLPYWAPTALILKGRTRFSQHWMGAIDLTNNELSLIDSRREAPLVTLDPRSVEIRKVLLWFGLGYELIQAETRWFVQPLYSPSRLRRSRKAAKSFRHAISEARGAG
jgi:hypothetical protein